jgi:hypothetical protein
MCAAALTLGFCSGPLGDWRMRRIEEPLFQPLSPASRQLLIGLFRQAWDRSDAGFDVSSWQRSGFDAVIETQGSGPTLLLTERGDRVEGKGRYQLRMGTHAGVLLEAPHSTDDLFTGDIVRQLFLDHPFAGAGFNSLSRWSVDRDAGFGDLARRADSALIAFGAAFLSEHPGGTVVQIHGFDSEKRGEASFAEADIVVSDGTPAPNPQTLAYRRCLGRLLPGRVLLYPDETRELGARRNATGRSAREAGSRFLHLELSLNLRGRLRGDSVLRGRFAACLLASVPS